MALRPGDEINRIGTDDVKGIVLSVVVDLGNGGPGNVVEVQVGESVQNVFDEACGRAEAVETGNAIIDRLAAFTEELRKADAIPRDGATMPSGTIEDVVDSLN